MPKINLRLTDEEHEELRRWASESHRSIQREAIFRLFSERSLSERENTGRASEPVSLRKEVVDNRASRSESDSHFKPDEVRTDFK